MSAVLANDRRFKISLSALRPLVYAGRFVQPGEIIDVAQEDAPDLLDTGAVTCRLDTPSPDEGRELDMSASADIPRRVVVREAFELDGRTYAPGESAELPESMVRVLFMRGLVVIS